MKKSEFIAKLLLERKNILKSKNSQCGCFGICFAS
jgi:hypothetical protein